MAFTRFLNGNYDVENQLPAYIIDRAKEYFRDEEKKKAGIKTVEDVNKRREQIRKCFIESIGGLDIDRTPLNPVCTGTVKRDGYSIRNVVYESMPKMYVTANLYVPDKLEGKAPAVIMAEGHSINGKAYEKYQKVCIDLARNGFVILAVDPPGQGRRQYYDRTEEIYYKRRHY